MNKLLTLYQQNIVLSTCNLFENAVFISLCMLIQLISDITLSISKLNGICKLFANSAFVT